MLLFVPFSAKDGQTRNPRSCHAHPNHFSGSNFSTLVFQKEKPKPKETSFNREGNRSTQQASSAAITLIASHKIPSELEFWHLTNIKVLTYAFVPIFISPHNISFRFHWFTHFLIKDFDISKPCYISYLGNIRRKTTQMGK